MSAVGASEDRYGVGVRLPIGPAPSGDAGRGLLRIPRPVMERLGLRAGDAVALEAGRRTHARALPSSTTQDRLGVDAVLLANADARWGSPARIARAALPALKALQLGAPRLGATPEELVAALADMAVTEGDRLELTLPSGRRMDVRVVATDPSPAGFVAGATRVTTDAPEGSLRMAGLGGLEAEIAAVHEIVELPLRRPDLFARLGMAPPRGVLFTGPPGSGKTLLARAVAERSEAAFFHIAGPEIVSKHYGDSEKALRGVFDAAAAKAPAIVFLDEIDAIAPRREALSGEKQLERRVVGQLLTLMDGLESRDRVVVMAATNLPDSLDPALRRPGRFDREIRFSVPDAAARTDILGVHLAQAPLAGDVDLPALAARCHGYVGADLAALAREAALAALARAIRAAGGADAVVPTDIEIQASDLETGFARTGPSALRAADLPPEPVRFADIGGLDRAKSALTEAILWPRAHGELVRRLRLSPPRGILLSGPPGGGKTLLVRAIATESEMNLIPVRPARLLSQFLGEAERAVAEVFRTARQTAPCLLFFDEIDAVAPARGRADAAMDRVVAQLLTEMDGLEDNAGVTVLAATNRPDAIDPAITRPGRFDLLIPIDRPDAAARREVLEVHLRGRPLAPDTDLDQIAAQTEGWSPAALASAVEAAARNALVRGVSAGPGSRASLCLTPQDFDRALSGQMPVPQAQPWPNLPSPIPDTPNDAPKGESM